MNSSISTRKKILAYLADARTQGVPVSGAALASALGISRNAVWKAIHTLQEEGYDIQSIQSKGYILSSSTDILSEELIREDLSASGIPENRLLLQVLDSVDSTNNYCRTLDYGNPATAVLADRQTGGRGRYGRTFESPKGTGIYLTYSFRPYFPLSQVTHVTSIAAVLTHRVLEKISGEKLGIKWVNDIYKGNLKICGILTEGLGSLESWQLRTGHRGHRHQLPEGQFPTGTGGESRIPYGIRSSFFYPEPNRRRIDYRTPPGAERTIPSGYFSVSGGVSEELFYHRTKCYGFRNRKGTVHRLCGRGGSGVSPAGEDPGGAPPPFRRGSFPEIIGTAISGVRIPPGLCSYYLRTF